MSEQARLPQESQLGLQRILHNICDVCRDAFRGLRDVHGACCGLCSRGGDPAAALRRVAISCCANILSMLNRSRFSNHTCPYRGVILGHLGQRLPRRSELRSQQSQPLEPQERLRRPQRG